ncbi:MAG: hypothetical protein E4G94_11320 [ANME-2 cluster archaeon]|jgi:hypothetical protein|nr:MAG: hypothetical protein E4G94_11320 [ANME-2 cluster archaeon]
MDKLTILKNFTYSFSAIHMLLFLGTVISVCLAWCSSQPYEGLGGLHIYIPHIFGTFAYASFVIYWLWWYVVAVPAIIGSLYLYGNAEKKYAILAASNTVMVLIHYAIKITYGFQIPD